MKLYENRDRAYSTRAKTYAQGIKLDSALFYLIHIGKHYRRYTKTRNMSDFFDELFKTEIPSFMVKCPVAFEWWYYDDEMVFAGINYERSVKAKRPMIDIHYCATKAMNGVVEKTVQYDKKRFKRA